MPRATAWTTSRLDALPPAVPTQVPLRVDEPETPAAPRRRLHRWMATIGRLSIQLVMLVTTILFLALAALPLVEHKALIVTSGSMEPLLSAGDAALIHMVPVDELRAGDVLTFQGYSSERLTTHRVVRPVELESGLHFQTQGDANPTPDANLAPAGGVVGRYVMGVPSLGRALLFLGRPHGQLLVVGLPALMILINELRYLFAPGGALRLDRRTAAIVGAVLFVSVATVGVLATTDALMTEATPIGGNTFTTADTFPA